MPDPRFPLKNLQELAGVREEDAGRKVAQVRARLQAAQQKAETLGDFREHYQRQMQERGAGGAPIGHLRDLAAFIARIDSALQQQRREVAQLEALWDAARRHWQDTRQATRTFDALEGRHLRREAEKDRRLEQKQQDEAARRMRGNG